MDETSSPGPVLYDYVTKHLGHHQMSALTMTQGGGDDERQHEAVGLLITLTKNFS